MSQERRVIEEKRRDASYLYLDSPAAVVIHDNSNDPEKRYGIAEIDTIIEYQYPVMAWNDYARSYDVSHPLGKWRRGVALSLDSLEVEKTQWQKIGKDAALAGKTLPDAIECANSIGADEEARQLITGAYAEEIE